MGSSNLIQTPLGIETNFARSITRVDLRSNLIQTPLGIETAMSLKNG